MLVTPSLRHCSNKYKLAREGEKGKEKDEDIEKGKEKFFFLFLVEDVEIGRLAGLRCHLCVMLEHGRETTGMVLKHMIEDCKGECVREDRNYT